MTKETVEELLVPVVMPEVSLSVTLTQLSKKGLHPGLAIGFLSMEIELFSSFIKFGVRFFQSQVIKRLPSGNLGWL